MDTKKIITHIATFSPLSPGFTYMTLSAVSFCFMSVFVKLAGHSLPTIQIVFVRGIVTLAFTVLLLIREKISPFGNHKKLLIARGITGTIALFLVYESIKRFSLSEATVIQYLFPIFTALIAAFIISESLNKNILGAILLGLFGVYAILGFPFLMGYAEIDLNSILIAITGSFLTGLAYVLVRQSTKLDEHPLVVMFYFPLFTVPFCFPFLFSYWIKPSLNEWAFLLLVGICTQLGQFFLTHGYKELPAAKAAPLSYIQVPLAMAMGMIFFEEVIDLNFIIGSTLVFISIFLVMSKSAEVK